MRPSERSLRRAGSSGHLVLGRDSKAARGVGGLLGGQKGKVSDVSRWRLVACGAGGGGSLEVGILCDQLGERV